MVIAEIVGAYARYVVLSDVYYFEGAQVSLSRKLERKS